MSLFFRNTVVILFLALLLVSRNSSAKDFADESFIVAKINARDYKNNRLWNFIEGDNYTGLEFDVDSIKNDAVLRNSRFSFSELLERIKLLVDKNESRIIPVVINYRNDVHVLDSIINASAISSQIFYLPQGEKWPSTEYLVQANRRVIFFVQGNIRNESRIMHHLKDYALQIGAHQITPNSAILSKESNINRELFKINNFHRLPIGASAGKLNKNLVPDYINFLLDSWTKVGKKPNFISVGNSALNFDFIIDQLNSFEAIKGQVRTAGRNLERVYWKNPDILITGGQFSFPIRGGEEVILTPFAPGFRMIPEQLIITNEMQKPEHHSIMANPMNLGEGLKASFHFDGTIHDLMNPERTFEGRGYSFSQDIDRGSVLRLPENTNVVLGDPNLYGLPNSSFTISCFLKFTDILEFGDNGILGNDERGYRRGMHLILRSGHPYFGLWANDYMSDEVLQNNVWYHLTWRYIIETGEQAIFVNGRFVGGSDGHPAYSGSSDLHLGAALSRGASLRGYIDNLHIWNRPLGNEEIVRLSSDEEVRIEVENENKALFAIDTKTIVVIALVLVVFIILVVFLVLRYKNRTTATTLKINAPSKNRIQLFGEFKAVNKNEQNVTDLFTPKVKELFIFIVIHALKNDIGAPIAEVDETLWYGIDAKKVANNRAVTLNKLRKLLAEFDTIEIISAGGYLQLKISASFSCDYMEAYQLFQMPENLSREQLELFFFLVKRGRLLKGTAWPWLDDIRGLTGNQVIDNLLKLASIYKKERKTNLVEKVAQRILDYDDLNEEAIYLQIWALQNANNSHLAQFNFKQFCSKYEKNMGEPYKMDFMEFTQYYSDKL